MAFESGGAGLWSTVDDYMKVARLFSVTAVGMREDPSPGNARAMMTNQMSDSQPQP